MVSISKRAPSGGMVGVILAAGRGTRMGDLTSTLPKPLLPVLGRPAIEWVIDGMVQAGVSRVVVVVGYLHHLVQEHLAKYRPAEVEILFVRQDEQAGTAHAMLLTRGAVDGRPVLLGFADIMTSPGNYKLMVDRFLTGRCDLTAAVRDAGDPWRAAAVYLDGDSDRISSIVEKPAPGTSTTPWSHAGMYCFSPAIFSYLEQVKPSQRGELEVTDAVSQMINDKLRCCAVALDGYWKDLATPADIVSAEELMAVPRQASL